ncbi:MAG: hypothetical protein JSW60_02495 [Thermoplasmatales archaeon]|nr:MAG: hypothetical protein JSW60_02495 [Thermoplasmatales archaeon]
MMRWRKRKLYGAKGRIKKFYILSTIFVIFISVINFTAISYGELSDLMVDSISVPDVALEGDNVIVNVTIKNIGGGDVPIGMPVEVGLFIDNEDDPVSTNVTYDGFSSGTARYFNLYWFAEIGSHSLCVFVDYNDLIDEGSNESNNQKVKYIEVSEGPPVLKITQFLVPENVKMGKLVEIDVSVKNVGSNTSDTISAELNIEEEGFTKIKEKSDGLSRGEIHNFSFEWTPLDFGNHSLLLTVKHGSDVHDQEVKTRNVYTYKLEWWNENWHYRKLIGLHGSGNFSEEFNFNELLGSLDVFSRTFENDTIRIIEYATNGEILDDNVNYNFTESSSFDNKINANGILTWEVTPPQGESVSKYYYIYFDVKENKGVRSSLGETENMTASDFTIIYDPLVEGWWDEIKEPPNEGYSLVEETLNIVVVTQAKADSVIAFLKKKNTPNEYTVVLKSKDGSFLNWSGYFNFTSDNPIGNWTIRINSSDIAGYINNMSENNFYVGKPDLAVISVIYKPSKIREKDIVTISADLRSYNVTMEEVNVSLKITDSWGFIINFQKNLTILIKDQANIVNFSWKAEKIGKYWLEVKVYRGDITDEWNTSNNKIILPLSVIGTPDLGVVDIIVPSGYVKEGDSGEILAVLNNTGNAPAENYKVRLYLSQVVMDWYDYQIKDTVKVSIDVNESIEVNLTWNPALYGYPAYHGEWIVGILIFYNNTYRDSFILNNSRTARLRVTEGEKNAPVIKITELTDVQEMGRPVSIAAEATDKSGIKTVNITITNPINTRYIENMMSEGDDRYVLEFDNTSFIGEYNFSVIAIDNSFYKMKSTVSGVFEIVGDETPPSIDYFGVHPCVQLKGGYVNISCISTDFNGVKSVKVKLTYPDDHSETKSMTPVTYGKYVYSQSYKILGKYIFNITSEDTSRNIRFTKNKCFWITTDVDDVDCDGMPDWWEERYGFDPYDQSDAEKDEDGDGFTNVEEYNSGNNPLKHLSSLHGVVYRLRENWVYLIVSVVLLISIIALSIYAVRRLKHDSNSK